MVDKSNLAQWTNAFIGLSVAVGSVVGVYTTLSSKQSANSSDIRVIKEDLITYSEYARKSRELIQHLLVKDAADDVDDEALKKTQEAAIRAIERMSASAEKLTIAIAKLEERIDKD